MVRARIAAMALSAATIASGAWAASAPSDLTVDFGAGPAPAPMAAPPAPPSPVAQPAPSSAGAAVTAAPVVAPAATPSPASAPRPVVAAAPERYSAADLVSQPTAQQIIDVYPPAAKLMSTRANAILECKVRADGVLEACSAAAQSRSTGFEDAALKLVPYFRMRPHLRDGQGVPGVASLEVRFSPSDLKAQGNWSVKR